MLTRLPGESNFDYHRRLINGKLVDRTLADVDYAELSVPLYGKPLSSDSTRKAMYGSRRTIELLEKEQIDHVASATEQGILSEVDMKMAELRKEQQRMFDQRTALNQVLRERARAEELNAIITKAIQNADLPELPCEVVEFDEGALYHQSDNDLLVSLNDIHFGAVVENFWCQYNPEICAQMMRQYADKVIEIAKVHQSKNCYIWANGDMISGNIHYEIAVSNRENLVKQVMGVSELIAQFICTLRPYFQRVHFTSVAGNHSRIGQKDKSIFNERLDDLVEWYLAARLQNCHDVVIGAGEKLDTTMYALEVRGKTYVGVHGDYDPTPAHIQTLQTMAQRPVYAVLLGHLHHCATNHVQGIRTVMAGSFQGMDSFCVQRRIVGRPEQMVCVCDESGIRCSYEVELGSSASSN